MLLIILALLCMVQLAWQWGMSYTPEAVHEAGWFFSSLPEALDSALVPAAILAVFLCFMRMPSAKPARIVTFLMTVVVASAVLIFGGRFSGSLNGQRNENQEIGILPFAARRIHVMENGAVFPHAVNPGEGRMEGIVLVNRKEVGIGDSDWSMLYAEGGMYSEKEGRLRTTAGDAVIRPANPVYGSMFKPPEFVRAIVDEVRKLNSYLHSWRNDSFESFVTASVALCTFAAGCYWCVRMTRWPLFNFIAAVMLLRVVSLIFDLFTGEFVQEMLEVIDNPGLVDRLPLLVFMLLGVIFVSLDLLFSKTQKST